MAISLVDVETLELMLGYDFNARDYQRAQMLLEMISGEVQSYCDAVTLQRIDNDIIYLRGSWANIIKLPGAPIHAIHSVSVEDGVEIVDYDWARHGILINPDRWYGPESAIRVVYDHGLENLPEAARSVVLSRAVRLFTNPEQVMQAKLGSDRSTSYAADVEQITGLNRSERQILKRFRRTVV